MSTVSQFEKNKLAINKYESQMNDAQAEIIKLTSEVENNKSAMDESKDSYSKLSNTIDDQKNKLDKLKTEYGSVVLEQGKNSKEAKSLSNEIKSLSNEIKNNESKLNESTKAIEKFTESEKDAGTQTLKLGDLIKANLTSEVIIAGVKGLASAMGSVIKGIANIGKEAVANFAEYEQLVGGVETLFKDSASVVSEYANNAYKSAGLSANEYMSTVTSFSASLLQSLNGDTAKSAQVADMAITDMADNANKMGTDMSMIQSAYQGFAKQNYTMLDNLKLGYGGTKTEMERLLSDATKLSGIKYDINNLNDVYQAIHVVQTELGITGTTAKEASSTISGSVSSMKSAWQNFLTGLASGQDISGLIDNLVQSVVTVMDNVLPVIYTVTETIVAEVPNLINKLIAEAPKFVELIGYTIETMIVGLQENLPKIMNSIMQVIQMIVKVITDNLPSILQMGITILVELVKGIAQSLPTLIPEMINAVILMVETLLDNIDLIIDAGIQLIMGLVEGLIVALPELIDKIPVIIDKLIDAVVNNLPKIIEMGIVLVVKLAEGLIKSIPNLIKAIPKIISSLIDGIKTYYSKIFNIGGELLNKAKDGISNGISKIADVGKNLVQGLWNGINNAKDWVLDKIKGFGKSVLNGIKSFFGIKSPSTLFRDEIGANLALGIGEGFEDEMSNVSSDIQNAIPTDFDLGINTNIDTIGDSKYDYQKDVLVEAFKEALSGMTFKAFDETFGELVVDNIEKVVYS